MRQGSPRQPGLRGQLGAAARIRCRGLELSRWSSRLGHPGACATFGDVPHPQLIRLFGFRQRFAPPRFRGGSYVRIQWRGSATVPHALAPGARLLPPWPAPRIECVSRIGNRISVSSGGRPCGLPNA